MTSYELGTVLRGKDIVVNNIEKTFLVLMEFTF